MNIHNLITRVCTGWQLMYIHKLISRVCAGWWLMNIHNLVSPVCVQHDDWWIFITSLAVPVCRLTADEYSSLISNLVDLVSVHKDLLSSFEDTFRSVLSSKPLVCATFTGTLVKCLLPSVLWRCWLGGRKGIRPVKNWVVGCWRGYLSGARCRLAYGPADATATHCLLLQ